MDKKTIRGGTKEMIGVLVGLVIGLLLGIVVMSLMKVSTINDLINRNQELEEINKGLEEALIRRTENLNKQIQELINIKE